MVGKKKIFWAFFCTVCAVLLSLYYFEDVLISEPFWRSVKPRPARPSAEDGHSPDGMQDNTSLAFNRKISNRVQKDTLASVERSGSNQVHSQPSKQTCLRGEWVPMQRSQGQEQLGLPEDLTFMYEKKYLEPQQPANTKKKLILVFNRSEWWIREDKRYTSVFRGCRYDACQFTDNRKVLPRADAVFFFVCKLYSRTPPPRHFYAQIWIAFCLEPPVSYYGYYNFTVWRGVFNWTMGYRVDSDVFYPYSVLALRHGASRRNYTSIAIAKTKPVAWLVSNCQTQSQRQRYVTELKKYINVDVYGRCSSLKCPKGNYWKCLEIVNKTYYFYTSFESSLCQDYVTEKFFKTFDMDVVPIVRGGANYSRYFPPGTFINTASYSSPKDLAHYLKSLMANPQAYARLLETKDRFKIYPRTGHYPQLCELCKRLHTSGSQSKVYPDFAKWTWDNACKQPSDV